jgi:hypothetical protein
VKIAPPADVMQLKTRAEIDAKLNVIEIRQSQHRPGDSTG